MPPTVAAFALVEGGAIMLVAGSQAAALTRLMDVIVIKDRVADSWKNCHGGGCKTGTTLFLDFQPGACFWSPVHKVSSYLTIVVFSLAAGRVGAREG